MKYLMLSLLTFLLISCGENSPTGPAIGVTATPAIVTHPADKQALINDSATFFVKASGGSLTYQWYRDDTLIKGASSASYTSSALSFDDDGSEFYVIVSNVKGSVTSNPAVLSVVEEITAPIITAHPEDQVVYVGAKATFKITATGVGISFQWYRNGIHMISEYERVLNIYPVSEMDDGTEYYCEVRNSKGKIVSKAATLTVGL